MRHGSIVDGQNLYHVLLGQYSPINHLFQVAKVADAEAVLRAKRENRESYTGSLPGREVEINVSVANGKGSVFANLWVGNVAIGVVLPRHNALACFIV